MLNNLSSSVYNGPKGQPALLSPATATIINHSLNLLKEGQEIPEGLVRGTFSYTIDHFSLVAINGYQAKMINSVRNVLPLLFQRTK